MEIEENRVYTFDEVLEILKLSPVTLRRLVRKGDIPAKKLGKQYRFLGAELIKALGGNSDVK
jgi:excisionase family DNA binding protein